MDDTVIVAIIGAIGVILGAAIPIWIKHRKKPDPANGSIKMRVGSVTSGGDSIIAGRDAIVIQQQILEDRFISKKGGKLIIETSREVIQDVELRLRWSSFDAKFLMKCIKDTPKGTVFDGEAFQEFRLPESDQMFSLGVKVYTACCRKISDKSAPDFMAFNRISQIYLNARMALRGS
jgi:hypothetical protein